MALFKAYNPKVEVSGEAVMSVIYGMGSFKSIALSILQSHGIINPMHGQWYPQQAWLDCFKKISEEMSPLIMNNIGKRVPEHAIWPPQIDSIETALSSIDVAYHMNHRNGEIGHYKFTKLNDHSATMVCTGPYPDQFDLGIIESVANMFKAPGENITVIIDENHPIRTKGGDSTTFRITWR